MKQKTCEYCQCGENCSLALLHAASDVYGFPLSEELKRSCRGVCSGFGIGSMCSAVIAAIWILGILFDEEQAKIKRLFFLLAVQQKFGALDCHSLSDGKTDCSALIGEIADILQQQIEQPTE